MKILIFFILALPLWGEVFRPLTILMDFPDYPHTALHLREEELINRRTGEEFDRELYSAMFFSPAAYEAFDGREFISARRYFHLESGGSFLLTGETGDIYGWYTAEREASYYGKNKASSGDREGAAALVREALKRLVEEEVDLSRYDLDGDGIIDGVMVVYAGRGEHFKNSLGSSAIWPHFNTFSDISRGPYTTITDHTGRTWMVNKYALIPQDIPMDLYIHEIGHFLGLSDLYGPGSTIGFWSNMAYLYTGEIPGSMPNSMGGYHRYNLQRIYTARDIPASWARIREYDLEDLKGRPVFSLLHNSGHRKSDNLIKINLPGRGITIPIKGQRTYYSGGHLNLESSFTLRVHLPRHTDNRLKMETWFNSAIDRKNTRLYVRKITGGRWELLENTAEKQSFSEKSRRWLPAEFDLNEYNGHTVEIRGVLLPSLREWRKGVYISDIRILADGRRILDIRRDREEFSFEGFEPTLGLEKLERYLLIEYRQPETGIIDRGLLETPYGIPYPGGIIVWYVDEDYTPPSSLVSLLPLARLPVYQVVKGSLIPMRELPYVVSGWIHSSRRVPEVAVERDGRYFYREGFEGTPSMEILPGIHIDILEETPARVLLNLRYTPEY